MAVAEKSKSPSSTVKKPPKKTSKAVKSSLSTEFVVDSDDSDERTASVSQSKEVKSKSPERQKKAAPSASSKTSNKTTKVQKTRKSPTPEQSSSQSSTDDKSDAISASQNVISAPVKNSSKPSPKADTKSQKVANNVRDPKKPISQTPSDSAKISSRTTKVQNSRKAPTPEESSPPSSAEDDSDASLASQDVISASVKNSSQPSPKPDSKSQKGADGIGDLKKPILQTPSTTTKTRETSSEQESDGSSQSSSGDGSESATGSEPTDTETTSPQYYQNSCKPVTSSSRPSYEPPSGFKAAKITIDSCSKLSEIFDPSTLKGKQIWHITAPTSVPINLVEEITTQNIQDRKPILSHKGIDYGLVPPLDVEQAKHQALLLPSSQNHLYRSCKTSFTNTFHLQQLVNLPDHQGEPNPPVPRPTTHVKFPRQQPQGLKMRYHPFGALREADSDDSEQVSTQATEFRKPKSVREEPSRKPEKKRKRSPLKDGEVNAAVSPVKRKRYKSRPEKSN